MRCRLARGEDEEAEDESPEATNRRLAAVQQAVDTYFRDPDPAATFEVSPPRIGLIRAAFARLKSLSRWAGGSAGASMSHEAAKEIAQLRSEKQRLQQLVRHLAGTDGCAARACDAEHATATCSAARCLGAFVALVTHQKP